MMNPLKSVFVCSSLFILLRLWQHVLVQGFMPRPSICPFRPPPPERDHYSCTHLHVGFCNNVDLTENDAMQFVGKTKESFKLADVYWLESCLSAHCYNTGLESDAMNLVKRLAFHRPTASYLLGYSNIALCNLPFRPYRFQYVARVVAAGMNPDELLCNIKLLTLNNTAPFWVLSYDTFEPFNQKVSSTMLMCAISRLLPGEPLLTGTSIPEKKDAVTYLIIETSKHLILVEKLVQQQEDEIKSLQYLTTIQQFRKIWSKRPFQYSGAINLDLAVSIIDMLGDVLRLGTTTINECSNPEHNGSANSVLPKTVRLLDPTCGSGTFLALAAASWSNLVNLELTGVDSNHKCARGTVSNLMKTFAIDDESVLCSDTNKSWTLSFSSDVYSTKLTATIRAEDSTKLNTTICNKKFDCAVTNLPWNRNTFEFDGSSATREDGSHAVVNQEILRAAASVLKPGAPMAVIGADDVDGFTDTNLVESRICLVNLGFDVLGYASVPPEGFKLPLSRKKNDASRTTRKGNSDCWVLIALAPER